tara:strand:+ start:434 stop:3589 length:3156 start_codon:yes stop_codon:yes gene_type:complete
MYTLEEVKIAYYKLKNYVYYDNTELLLREKLIEFETDTKKDDSNLFSWEISEPYSDSNDFKNIFATKKNTIEQNLEIKFAKLFKEINSNNLESEYFKYLISQIKVDFFPKKIKSTDNNLDKNFISNVKCKENYEIEKITPFINAPLEFHIISIMWIIRSGYKFDAELLEECKGNRLLLNKERTNLIQNSSLFKPYYSQYQSWRDDSVSVAQELLKNKKNALFINLDIKNYFNSANLDYAKYFPEDDSVNNILRALHKIYSFKLISDYEIIDKKIKNLNESFLLPIGLLSSYVIANHYLNDLDKIIIKKIKPAYYGRYVDDILIVISDPKESIEQIEKYNDYKINHIEFVKTENSEEQNLNKIKLSKIERYIIENLDPIFQIVVNGKERKIKIDKYENLYCQQGKTLMYYFDFNESDIVIDKLKQELNYRSSEFKDLPDDNENLGDIDKNALYLNYTDSDGKIRTLKDYKENRFGLTVYLTNKILGATKHKKSVSDSEINSFIKIFNGQNTIEFYKLWEKIFTYLLVNDKPSEYIDFYFQCIQEINKIEFKNKNIKSNRVRNTLINYLDSAHELALSLNLNFIDSKTEIKRSFEFKSNLIEANLIDFFFNRITRSNSIWALRYRKSNMMRHQYISIPLLNYTQESYDGKISLINYNVNLEKYNIDDDLLKNSPRSVKFWECTISKLITDINSQVFLGEESKTAICDFTLDNENHFLDQSFERFKTANSNHKPDYLFEDKIDNYRDKFYKIGETNNNLTGITVNSKNKDKLFKPKISVANTKVNSDNVLDGLRQKTNVTNSRYQNLVDFLKSTRKNKSDIVIFPEYFIPLELLSSLVRYSEKNENLVISGMEHITINNRAYNFIATILPININGYKDATIVFRLKNHYSPAEEELIIGNHIQIPNPIIQRYHIFNWKNVYFSVFYCFELTNILHRSALKAKIDLLVAVEYNKDVNYFSNLVESVSRDLHCYVAQVNSSDYGDTRITQPTQTYNKDIIKVKGGENNVTLTGTIEIDRLREFQRKKYNITKNDKSFKALPPDFDVKEVLKRINNK